MTHLVLNFDDEFIQEIQATTEKHGLSIESYFKQLFYRQKKSLIDNDLDDYVVTNQDVDDK